MGFHPFCQAEVAVHGNEHPPPHQLSVAYPMPQQHSLITTTTSVETIMVLACYIIEVMPCDALWLMNMCYRLITQIGKWFSKPHHTK